MSEESLPVRRLAAMGVPFTLHEHAPMRTVRDHEAGLQFPTEAYLKVLAFRAGDGWALAALRGRDRLDYRRLTDALGVSRSAIAAATAEELTETFGCESGGVCPMPATPAITLLLDREAAALDVVYTGSGHADRTLELRMADLLRAVTPLIVPLRRIDDADA